MSNMLTTDFQYAVHKHFNFLENVYQFKLMYQQGGKICYSSKYVDVTITFDAVRTHEIDVWFDLKKYPGKYSFNLFEIESFLEIDTPGQQAYDANTIEFIIKNIAEFIKQKLTAVITGEEFFYRRVDVFVKNLNRQYTLDIQMRNIRNQLIDLWQKKDYTKIVALLQPVVNQLNRSELMKLSYAKKHLND